MPPAAPRKGLAIASLALGLVGLVTAGGCGVLGLAGLILGVAALVRAGRDPAVDGGRDVAWAGLVTSGVSLLTIIPVVFLLVALSKAGTLPDGGLVEDDLPEPVAPPTLGYPLPPPPSTAAAPSPSPEVSVADPPAPEETPAAAPRPGRPAGPAAPPQVGARVDGVPAVRGALAPVRVGGEIREPTKLRHVNPVYPEIAKQARVQGVVILEATISPTGTVTEVHILRGVPLLNQAAVEAVQQWEYTPTLLNDVPVPVIMTVTVNFRLH